MVCRLQKNDYPEIELLFGEQYDSYYRSRVYDLYGFEQADSVSFNLDFYNQFLQEETEEDAKEWCLKTAERDIFEHLYKKYKSEIDAENEESEDAEDEDNEEEISPPEKLADFFDDYKDLSECFNKLKEYSIVVMHNIWNSKQVFKVGQKFSVVRNVLFHSGYDSSYTRNAVTFNLFPEMYSTNGYNWWNRNDSYNHSFSNNSDNFFYISEISRFDSTSYKLELSMNKYYGDGAIIEKLKFIVQKGAVLTFKYYHKGEKTYFVNATVTNIKNNEIEFEFGLFGEKCLVG